jgi:hypothetical protein
MADPKVRVFRLSLSEGWVVMDGHNMYIHDHKVHRFDFSLG